MLSSDFDAPEPQAPVPPNGKSNTPEPQQAPSPETPSKKKTVFAPVSKAAANAAKKGTTSNSRTGEGTQASYAFGTFSQEAKDKYFTLHPSPSYHARNLPVFYFTDRETFHYVDPVLFESGDFPERFQKACKVM